MIFIWSIRRCQIPIGRAKTKNWNLWLCHIKQRSGQKVHRILCWWYRDWWQSIRGMTREVLKCLLLLYESKEWPKKGTRRPTKTAKNTKTVIFGKKKAPAASRQPRKMVLFLEKRYLGQKKSACGKPPAKMPTFLPKKTAKNTKIVTKWSFMGRNGTSTIPKWSEKQDQQNPDRVIAPKPLKWGFKRDLMAANFSKIFAIFGPMDTK